jgi:hypothetical protein
MQIVCAAETVSLAIPALIVKVTGVGGLAHPFPTPKVCVT